MHTRPFPVASLLAGLALLLSGCASLLHSDHQSVRIFSEPSEASVTVDGRVHLTTVGTVNLSRFENHTAVFEKEGYEPVTFLIERSMSKQVWWNHTTEREVRFIADREEFFEVRVVRRRVRES